MESSAGSCQQQRISWIAVEIGRFESRRIRGKRWTDCGNKKKKLWQCLIDWELWKEPRVKVKASVCVQWLRMRVSCRLDGSFLHPQSLRWCNRSSSGLCRPMLTDALGCGHLWDTVGVSRSFKCRLKFPKLYCSESDAQARMLLYLFLVLLSGWLEPSVVISMSTVQVCTSWKHTCVCVNTWSFMVSSIVFFFFD